MFYCEKCSVPLEEYEADICLSCIEADKENNSVQKN